MKIIIIGTAYPYRGGLASYNERLARELLKERHNVTIKTFILQYPNFLFPGKTQYSEENSPEDLNIVRCINSVNPFNWISVGNQIKKTMPDLIIIKYWLPFMGAAFGTILRRIKSNGRTKVICIVDNMIPHESRTGDKQLTKYFIKPVDAFVAMSENVLNDIESFDAKKPKILSPHPIFDNFGNSISREDALQKLGLDLENRYILFFGLIRKYKGLDLLIKAFADNRFRHLKLKLIIAGEYYSDKELYANLIKEYSLENDIIQIDRFIQDSEVKFYFNAADLVVQPYKSATQSGVTQIAYHFNKPMIVTDVGGLAELCPHEKVGYVISIDPNEIADAIYRYFTEGDQNKFINNIIEEKKKYSWSVLVDNILKTFNKL